MSESQEVLEPRVYEVGFHILPTTPEDGLAPIVDEIKKAMADLGGLPIAEEAPRMTELAYPMYKVIDNKKTEFTRSYFGWIKFDLSPENVEKVEAFFAAHAAVLRHLIFSTVRENTLAPKKFSQPKRDGKSDKTHDAKPEKNVDPIAEMGAPLAADTSHETPAEEATEKPIDEAAIDKQIDELVSEE